MENASKAVMIAGGVLIAIIVISLGMYIWGVGTGAFGAVEQKRAAALREEQMVKFSQYASVLYGSEVENCIRRVGNYNELNGTDIKVTVEGITDNPTLAPKGYYNSVSDINIVAEANASYAEYKLNQLLRNDKYRGGLREDALGNLVIIFKQYDPSLGDDEFNDLLDSDVDDFLGGMAVATKVGVINGAGYNAYIDSTTVPGWSTLDKNDFFIDCESIIFPSPCTGTIKFTKSYDQATGQLHVNRTSITGSGIITFYSNVYARDNAEFIATKTGTNIITIDCTGIENWNKKNIKNFIFDMKTINVPKPAEGTLTFTKTYDENSGILTISRNDVATEGTISFTVDVYIAK